MHEHLVQGFHITAVLYEVALTAEKAPLLFVDAHAMVQEYVAKEYESAVEIETNPTQALIKFFILGLKKNSRIRYV